MRSDPEPSITDLSRDIQLCRRARLSRDSRFDGAFFIAVRTTGIYCRPICPAGPPAEKNVRYYRDAAQAAQAGFRPCLRCRPESAPHSPAWKGTTTTVERALLLIRQGVLNDGSMDDLAQRLGIGQRYLRKLFQQELGISPQAVALNQRLLFARKLLLETSLPITQVAYAAGFGSVRRFNSALLGQLKMSPSTLRKGKKSRPGGSVITLQLQYRPPYDWAGVIDYFSRHAIAGVEDVDARRYQRNISLSGAPGSFTIRPCKGKNALQLELQIADASVLMPVVANIRRMFDLDAHPLAIEQVLGQDPVLAPLLARCAGIRSPGSWSAFESALRTIVGQQVSTKAARSVIARLAVAANKDSHFLNFPDAAGIAALPDAQFPMPSRRRDTLRAVCQHFSGREEELDIATLSGFKGIGPWTTALVTMRGLGQPDIFPLKDLGLDKAWAELDGGKTALQDRLCDWRPWGSYAANLLWRSLSL